MDLFLMFSVLLMININRCNIHKQKLFGVLNRSPETKKFENSFSRHYGHYFTGCIVIIVDLFTLIFES